MTTVMLLTTTMCFSYSIHSTPYGLSSLFFQRDSRRAVARRPSETDGDSMNGPSIKKLAVRRMIGMQLQFGSAKSAYQVLQ